MTKIDLKHRIQQALQDAPHRESIQRLALFGSRAYGKPRADSDVDLLIEFQNNAHIGLFGFCGIQSQVNLRQSRRFGETP